MSHMYVCVQWLQYLNDSECSVIWKKTHDVIWDTFCYSGSLTQWEFNPAQCGVTCVKSAYCSMLCTLVALVLLQKSRSNQENEVKQEWADVHWGCFTVCFPVELGFLLPQRLEAGQNQRSFLLDQWETKPSFFLIWLFIFASEISQAASCRPNAVYVRVGS